MKSIACILTCTLLPLALCQVVAPNKAGVSMGHLHLNSKDPEAQKKFWMEVAGAQAAKLGAVEVLQLPGTIIFINKKEPAGGSAGSAVNHVGFAVRDLKAVGGRAEAGHFPIVTRDEKQLMVLAPDDIRVEFTLDDGADTPVRMHHIHFYTTDVDAARNWYASVFGAIPGKRKQFEAADLPGVNLSFSKADSAPAGTKGRSIDHIGFEVKGLEAFARNLEASGIHFDVPYRQLPQLGLAIAFFTDAWGTYIELTEGLTKVR